MNLNDFDMLIVYVLIRKEQDKLEKSKEKKYIVQLEKEKFLDVNKEEKVKLECLGEVVFWVSKVFKFKIGFKV